jgi:hypothetical protein
VRPDEAAETLRGAAPRSESTIDNRQSRIRWWPLVLLVAVVALTYWPAFLEPPGRDQGVFAYVASGMLDGYAPYRDSWDLKPPGVYLTYAAAFLAGGKSMVAVRFTDLAFTLATTLLIWRLATWTFGGVPGLAAALLYGLGSSLLYTFWARSQAETFLVLFLVLCYLLALKRKWVLAGFVAAVVFWYKITWILAVLPVLMLMEPRAWPRVALGALAGIGGVVGYLAVFGGLREMAETVFLFNRYYGGTHINASLLTRIPRETVRFVWRSGIVGPLAVVGFARGSPKWMKWWFLGAFVSVWSQGKLFMYHWIPALAPLVLLAGGGVRNWSWRPGRRAIIVLGAVFLLAGVPDRVWVEELYPLYNHYKRSVQLVMGTLSRVDYLAHYGGRASEAPFSYLDDEELAAFCAARTAPDDPVLVWGFEPLVNFMADRRSPSRFSFDYPLTFPAHTEEARLLRQRNRELFFVELHNRPPRLIALAIGDRNPVEAIDSLEQMKAFPEFALFLHKRYHRVARIGHFLVLERK